MPQESPAVNHQPWQTRILPLAPKGLQLNKPLTNLEPVEASRLTNCIPRVGGGLDTRLGLTTYLTYGTSLHTIKILNDAKNNTFALFWGIDANWVRTDAAGVPTLLSAGFSGNPLTMVSAKPPQAAETWIYVADTNQVGKITRTGVPQFIGYPKPAQPSVSVAAPIKTPICAFDSSDGTQAASWNTGCSTAAIVVGDVWEVAVLSDIATPRGDNALLISSGPQTVPFSQAIGLIFSSPLDLSVLPGGVAASDDDIIHLWLRTDNVDALVGVAIYLVTSAAPDSSVVPGTSDNAINNDAYWILIPGSRLKDAQVASQQTVPATAAATSETTVTVQTTDPTASPLATPRWAEFGRIGVPLRRGDFQLIDPTSTRNWSTVTAIIVAVQTEGVVAPATTPPTVALDDMYLTGGYRPDTSEPGSQPFDYRVTNFDPLTGAEGNPSDVMPTTEAITIGTPGTVTALRQQVTVTPAASGLAGAKQRLYRRGGQNVDDWYFIGPNTVDGGAIIDNVNDVDALAAGALEIDHDQPVTSVDTSGNTLLAQPVRVFFGLIDDLLFALGDINRPGDLYWSKPGDYDSWPAANRLTVCPPSEELMNGIRWGGQGFVFSRERGYSIQVNLAAEQQVQAVPTDCSEGMAGYWCCCACQLGIAFVSLSGVRVTQGGASTLLSVALDPLFHGESVNGYSPIDFTARNSLRLTAADNELWFGYKDTAAAYRWMVYSFITQTWRSVSFAVATNVVAGLTVRSGAAVGDPGTYILVGGQASGKGYIHSGSTDDGSAISCQYRSGAEDFDLAEEKLLGEFFVEGDLLTAGLTGQTFLNGESVTNTAQAVSGLSGYNRYVFEPFGTQPQHARSLSIDLTWSGTAGISPSLAKIGVAFQTQPETTMNRATAWDAPSEHPIYLYGCWIDSDTGGSARTIVVEGLQDSATVTLATLSVNSAAGRRQWFSWTAQRVDQVRLRPSGTCEPWLLFGCRWIYKELPDYIAGWDTQGDILGDSYITGVDLVVDTGGLDKEVKFYVDTVLIKTSQLGAVAGKRLIHISFDISTPLRGHIGQILSTDGIKGLLYEYKWVYDKEPGEQYNLNLGFTAAGSLTDKWLKGVILEVDTFNQTKTLNVEVDGVVISSPTFLANGRKVINLAWAQTLGRIFRVYATDSNPARLYSAPQFLFDEEPFALTRYETQELTCGVPGWKILPFAEIAIKSSAEVTLTMTVYGDSGQIVAMDSYALASTASLKQSRYVPFAGRKGYLYKFLFTCASAFWLYREESIVWVQPVVGGDLQEQRPFGDDDFDNVRAMRNASAAAVRSGGGEQR
jgi:hypothetical protein